MIEQGTGLDFDLDPCSRNRKWTSWHHHQIVQQDQTHVYFETKQSPLTNDTHNIVHPGKQHRSHRTKLHETSLQDGDDERNDPYYSQVSAAGDHHEKGLKYHSNHIF
jgi:hypothetical protein